MSCSAQISICCTLGMWGTNPLPYRYVLLQKRVSEKVAMESIDDAQFLIVKSTALKGNIKSVVKQQQGIQTHKSLSLKASSLFHKKAPFCTLSTVASLQQVMWTASWPIVLSLERLYISYLEYNWLPHLCNASLSHNEKEHIPFFQTCGFLKASLNMEKISGSCYVDKDL